MSRRPHRSPHLGRQGTPRRARRAGVLSGCLLALIVAPVQLVLGTGFGHVHLDQPVPVFHQHGNLGAHRHPEPATSRHESPEPEALPEEDLPAQGRPGADPEPRTIPFGADPAVPAGVAIDALAGPRLLPAGAARRHRDPAPAAPELSVGGPRGPPQGRVPVRA
jgi:hypothetical protein